MALRDDDEEANEDNGVRPRIDVERVFEFLRLRLHVRGTMGCSIGLKEGSTKVREQRIRRGTEKIKASRTRPSSRVPSDCNEREGEEGEEQKLVSSRVPGIIPFTCHLY
ncbi:hypothetical protein AAC387_Pa06g1971 [Persea americana]